MKLSFNNFSGIGDILTSRWARVIFVASGILVQYEKATYGDFKFNPSMAFNHFVGHNEIHSLEYTIGNDDNEKVTAANTERLRLTSNKRWNNQIYVYDFIEETRTQTHPISDTKKFSELPKSEVLYEIEVAHSIIYNELKQNPNSPDQSKHLDAIKFFNEKWSKFQPTPQHQTAIIK